MCVCVDYGIEMIQCEVVVTNSNSIGIQVVRTSLPKGVDGKDPAAVADVFTKELHRIQPSIGT